MLDRLKIEVACSADDSLSSCAKALNAFTTNDDFLATHKMAPSCSQLSPLAKPAMASTGRLMEVLDSRTSQGHLVSSVEEFYEHTQKHRARVKALGLELYKSHSGLFEGLEQWQVEQILEAHDQAKIRSSIRAPDGRPFYQVLYNDGFGKKLDRTVVDSLNANDKAIMELTEEKFGVKNNPDLRAKIERIEKIADLVDRGMSPVSPEEFGRTMEKASQFMSNAEDRELAQFLEKRYFTVTKDLQYKSLSPLKVGAVANRLYLQEHFSSAFTRYGSKNLSARSLAHAALSGGRKLGAGLVKILSNRGLAAALSVAEGPLLYFSEIKNTGCSERGYHDWIQDPHCKPAIGLTPKVIEFLNEDWETQKFYLKNDHHTCEVIQKTYAQSIQAPLLTRCDRGNVEFKTANGDRIQTQFDSHHNITSVNFEKNSLLNKIYPKGAPRSVKLKPDGTIENVCNSKKCFSGDAQEAQDPAAFVRSLNYQIQKAVHCCQPANGFLKTRCQ